MNFLAVELRSVVIQSLRIIQTARKALLPLTTNLSTAAALASRSNCFLNEIRVIRARLRVRFESSDVVADKRRFRSTHKDALRALARPPYSFLKVSAVNRNR